MKRCEDLIQHKIKCYENNILAEILSKLRGLHIVMLGDWFLHGFDYPPHIPNSVNLTLEKLATKTFPASNIIGTYDELPFLSDSIDVMVIPHLLETDLNKNNLLEEVWRVLRPEGRVIFTGYNTLSFLSIAHRKFLKEQGRTILTPGVVKQLLLTNNFLIEKFMTFSFSRDVKPNSILEKIGRYLFLYGGNIYLFLAQKKIIGVTPLKFKWQNQELNLAGLRKIEEVSPSSSSTRNTL